MKNNLLSPGSLAARLEEIVLAIYGNNSKKRRTELLTEYVELHSEIMSNLANMEVLLKQGRILTKLHSAWNEVGDLVTENTKSSLREELVGAFRAVVTATQEPFEVVLRDAALVLRDAMPSYGNSISVPDYAVRLAAEIEKLDSKKLG